MPDRPGWADRIPDALEELQRMEGPYIGRQQIEVLLEVKPRRANDIIQIVGAQPMGKALVVEKELFVRYLRSVGGEELTQQEKARRKEFAKRLAEMQREHQGRPFGGTEIIPEWKPKPRPSASLEGVEFGPGVLIVRCPEGALQLAARLYAVADFLSKELPEAEERLSVKQ
jgi:hypothetical protein